MGKKVRKFFKKGEKTLPAVFPGERQAQGCVFHREASSGAARRDDEDAEGAGEV